MKDKKTIYLAIAAGIITIITIALATLLFIEPSIKAVDFTNKNVEEIKAWQKENNIDDKLIEYKEEYDEKIEKDFIISQSVKGGENIKDKIIFTVSKGSDPSSEVTLIDFKDKTEDEIRKYFEENKFTDVTYEYIPDEKIAKGKFIKLNITETKVKRNTLIVVSISAGSSSVGVEIEMPDFKDSNKANIDAWAKTNNINVAYTYAFSDKFEENKVISFSPKALTKIKTGDKIQVTISKGKGITISDLVGKKEEEATSWFKDNGLLIDKIEVYSEKTKGNVTFLNPKAGSIVAKGSTVKVYVSVGLVPVDNYVNKSKSSFESWLLSINKKFSNTAELKVSYQEIESSTVTAGNIIKMTFDGSTYTSTSESGKLAKPGQTITVQVSKGTQIKVEDKRGLSETDFQNYIKGLKLNYSKGTAIYSDTYSENKVAKHQTGSFAANATITYQLSLGKYGEVASYYNGKTPSAIKNELTAANNLEAGGWTYTTKAEDWNSATKGTTYGCSISGKTVSCNVSKGEKPAPVTVNSFAGKTLAEFKTFIVNNKLALGNESSRYDDSVAEGDIISNATGTFEVGSAIDYVVSKGKEPPTSASIIDLSFKTVVNDPQGSKDSIYDYLSGLGFTNIRIEIITHDYTPGNLIIYPAAGTYNFSDELYIEVSKGPK